MAQKQERRVGMNRRGVSFGRCGDSAASRHFEPGANVRRNLCNIVIHKMADAVIGNAAELGPIAERGDGRFLVLGKNPAGPEAKNIRELAFGPGREFRFHTPTPPVKSRRRALGRGHAAAD